VTLAGGLEPEVVQTKSYFLPADSGWFASTIFTSNGLTENYFMQSVRRRLIAVPAA